VGKITVKRLLGLFSICMKMDLGALLRDTKFMIIAVIADIFADVSAISGIFLLAWKFDGIGGLDRYEILFMLAFGGIVHGMMAMFGQPNANVPSRIIARGQWEHMFIMPLPYGIQLIAGFFPFTCSGGFISSVILMAVAVNNLSAALAWWWILLLIVNIFVGMVIVLGVSYLVSSFAFYAPVQCEELSSRTRDSLEYTGTFPLSGMPLYMKIPLLTIFPAGLTAWLPTLIILGKTPKLANLYPVIFAALVSLAASYFFKKGFRYYVKKGINRYHSMGHRR
jgi:ABC-2 type transport system permease protein